jgi:hypothetical protein
LSQHCSEYVETKLLPLLQRNFEKKLTGNWRLELDKTDQQTILFYYPKVTATKSDYIRPAVKIELGSRSEHFPSSHQILVPYIQSILPDSMSDMHTKPKVL